jgi:hypothetical protein
MQLMSNWHLFVNRGWRGTAPGNPRSFAAEYGTVVLGVRRSGDSYRLRAPDCQNA